MYDIWTVGKNNDTKMKLTEVKLNNDKYGYSLAVTYQVETLDQISELHFPRMALPFKEFGVTIERTGAYSFDSTCVDVGFGRMNLLPGDDGEYFTRKVIKTKTKEMTLEEIEKKLGHKVKIVNK